MNKKMNNRDADDEFEGDYIGNLWGWKFSKISAIMISLLLGLMAYRALVLGEPIFEDLKKEDQTEQIDSLKTIPNQ